MWAMPRTGDGAPSSHARAAQVDNRAARGRNSHTMRWVHRALAVTAVAVCAAFLPQQLALAGCPDNLVELKCGGLPVCRPSGSSCCGAVACSADLVCLTCDSNLICAPPGSTCCGNVMCPPGQECMTCGTVTSCRPRGEGCPSNMD